MFLTASARRRTALITAAVAIAAAGATWAILRSPAKDAPPPACGPVVLAPQQTAPAGRAPDGGGLRVAEQGFTQLGADRDQVAVGAIVENTSRFVAYHTRITLEFFDAGQNSLLFKEFLSPRYNLDIPVIQPGERIGYGRVLGLGDGNPAKVSVFAWRLHLGTTQWRAADPALFATVTGAFERDSPQSDSAGNSGTLTYRETSSHCGRMESHGVVSIYRDSSGAIVGGHLDVQLPNGNVGCQPGSAPQRVYSWFGRYPHPVDLTKTGIYPYCDVVPWNLL